MATFSSWQEWLLAVGVVVSGIAAVITLLSGTAVVALLLALLALGGFTALRYQSWIHDRTRQLQDGSKLIETPKGRVEYALSGAAGPVILFVHGQPGGYDQGAVLADVAAEHGFRFLSPSRPGYLRTPLDLGRSAEQQADALAALLGALRISRVAVVSLSGGGPAALQFALRHPARCWALVAITAVSCPHAPPATLTGWLLSTRLFTSNAAGWLMGAAAQWRPALLAQLLLPDTRSRQEVLSDPAKLSALIALAQAGIMLPAQRRAGSRNDLQQAARLPLYPVEEIRAPTLVIHGTADELVPYEHALFIARAVPGAELHAIEGGGHAILVTHRDRVLSHLFTFLTEHTESAYPFP